MAGDGEEDLYRQLFSRLVQGVTRCRVLADDLIYVETNPAFAELAGTTPTPGTRHSALAHPWAPLADLLELARAPATIEVHLHGEGQTGGRDLKTTAYRFGDDVVFVIADVTARRRLQDLFLRAFTADASALAITRHRDGQLVDANKRFLELVGRPRGEVLGRSLGELGLPAIAHEETEIAFRARDGREVIALARSETVELEAHGTCTLATMIDITSRRRAEEAFATVFESSPVGKLLIVDETNLIAAVNPRLLEQLGYTRAEMVGRSVVELDPIPESVRPALRAELERTGRVRGAEIAVVRKPGDTIDMLVSTERITINGVRHRLAAFTDISERRLRERRLVTQHAVGRALAEGIELAATMPAVLEALAAGEDWDCGAVWLPANGDLQCVGTWARSGLAAEELARVTRATVPVAHTGLLGRVLATGTAEKVELDPARGPHGRAAFAAGMRRATAFPILRGSEVLGVVALASAADGSLELAELDLFDSIGRMIGLFVERSRALASLRDSEAFTSSVSHDLRAPLRAINSFSEILLEDFGPQLPEEARAHLHSIANGGRRLREVIDDLLAFARLGRAALRRRAVDLDAMVREVASELVAHRHLEGQVDLRIAPLGTCDADPSLLRQVWVNLIDNALKYSRGRDPIVVEVTRSERGGEVVYGVRDHGVGFDMRYADRLFGVFQRLHSAEEFEGTGVGLANVRRIVERHGGQVTARSELGAGSLFELTLDPPPSPDQR